MNITRSAALVALAATSSFALASPADAASSSIYRSSGTNLSADWVQRDAAPGPFGNVHVGFLYTYDAGGADGVDVYISDFLCEEGQEPWGDPHSGENACEYIGDRYGSGYDVDISVNKKLTAASLDGEITMYHGGGHGGGEVVELATIEAHITFTGIGSLNSSWSKYHENYDGTVYQGRYKSTSRQATVDGQLGPMGFSPDSSGGYISTYRDFSKTRTK